MTNPISPDFTLPDVEDYTDDITKDSDFSSLKHLSDADRKDLSKWMKLVLDSQSRQVAKIAEANAKQMREGRMVRIIEIGSLLAVAVGMALVAKAINNYDPPLPIANSKANDEIMAAMLEKMDRPNPELIKLQEQIKALQAKKSEPVIVTRTVYLSPKPKHTISKKKNQAVFNKSKPYTKPKKIKIVKAEAPFIDIAPVTKSVKPVIDINDAGMPVLK